MFGKVGERFLAKCVVLFVEAGGGALILLAYPFSYCPVSSGHRFGRVVAPRHEKPPACAVVVLGVSNELPRLERTAGLAVMSRYRQELDGNFGGSEKP